MSNPSEQPNNNLPLSDCFQGLEISDLRKKRDEYIQEIRSRKRDVRICSRRRLPLDFLISRLNISTTQEPEDTFGQGVSIQEFIADCQKRTYTLEQLNELVTSLNSPNRYRQHFGVIGIRHLLSTREVSPPIQAIIDAGVLPKLIEFLGKDDEQQLQLEAAWALSNVAVGSTKQIQEMVDNGVVPGLIRLMGSPNKEVQAQAIWALANISADNVNFRDVILQEAVIGPLMKVMEGALAEENLKLIKEGNWLLATLCQRNPLPPYGEVQDAVAIFAKVILSQTDDMILKDALWSLKCLSNGDEERIQRVIDTGIVPSLVKFLEHPWIAVATPCMKIIGNLFTGTIEQVDHLLSIPGVLDKLFNALKHPEKTLQIDAAEILSGISAGTSAHKELIVGNADYLNQLFSIGFNDPIEVRREVARIFNNAITEPAPKQLKIFQFWLEKRVFDSFVQFIEEKDEVLQDIGLTGIQNILRLEGGQAYEGSSRVFYWSLLEKNKMIEVIERLQNHAMKISKVTSEILSVGNLISEERRNGD